MSIELAEQYEEKEEYEKAFQEYKQLLDAKPSSIDLMQRLAHVACILNRQDDVEHYFTKILEKDATNELAYEQLMDLFFDSDKYKYYSYRGNLHVLQGKLQHAAGDFKKALDKAYENDQRNATRFALAGIYAQLNKTNQAIDEYLRLLDTQEAPVEAYLLLAQIYLKEDILSSAAEILERAIKDGHETKEVKETLADIYLRNNQTEQASKISSDKLVQLRCLIDDEKYSEALTKIEELQNEYKKNPKFLSLVAQYYYATGDYDKALEYVDEFAKFDKNSPLIYQMRALIYEEQGETFKEHYNWAKYNQARGNKDVALNEYMFAHQANPEDSALIITIADLLESMKDNTHAIEFYEKLYRLEPQNRRALEKLGAFRESIGDYKMAIEYLEKLYEIDKRNPKVLKSLAVSYEKTRNAQKALEFYEKYLSSNSIDEAEIAEIKKKIEKLESKKKEYSDASTEDDGLIGKIMKIFGK